MLIASFPAGPLAANCYVVAAAAGAECVIIDPGMDASPSIDQVVTEHHLTPVAVVASHGHLDHVGAATATCRRFAVPCHIAAADRFMLTDPLAALSPSMHGLVLDSLLEGADPATAFTEPEEVLDLGVGRLRLAGRDFDTVAAPGHTAGSVMLRTSYPDDDRVDSLLFSGDVLFQGSVGRTDLPGGDPATMLDTLRREVLPLPDAVVVLPGHGAQTSIGAERARNPYMVDAA